MGRCFCNRRLLGVAIWVWLVALPSTTAPEEPEAEDARGRETAVADTVHAVWSARPATRRAALRALVDRGRPDVVPALIQALRFVPDHAAIDAALSAITGERQGGTWFDWMLWQQDHDEIEPFPGFDAHKADVMAAIDDNFRLFLRADVAHEIRLEEIVWGGVRKDGIPALVNPKHIPGRAADYLEDDELVFSVEIDGDARAYPLRILDWHEMFNDVVGGVPVSLAYLFSPGL